MPIVTAIKFKEDKNMVDVYLDGKFGLRMDFESFYKQKLKVEQVLSSKDVNKLKRKSKFQNIYQRLIKFSNLRPRSKKEVELWLRRKKVDPKMDEKLIKKLEQLALLDDRQFTRWWIEQRIQFRPRSKRMLEKELRQKGVDLKLIRKVMEKQDIDEVVIASKLIEKKKYLWRGLDKTNMDKRKIDYLLRQGFKWDVVKKVVKDT
jgi:regulatory protein